MRSIQGKLALILAVVLCMGMGVVSAAAAPETSMEQTVILDNDLITLTVTDFDPDSDWGPTFEILMESKSDKNLRVYMRNAAVNGIMCDSYCSEDVPAGKKVYGDMSWYEDDLAFCGINYIETVNAVVEVSDADSYDTLSEDNVSWAVTVGETDVPAVETPAFDFEPIGVSTGDIVFSVINYDLQGAYDGSPALIVYMENNTDAVVSFSADDVTVNGFMCDPYWSETVSPGMAAYGNQGWDSNRLAESHVASIENIGFNLIVRDPDSWDLIAQEPVAVTVGESSGETAAVEGTVLLDDENATVTVTNFDPEADWGPSFEILVENKTDKTLSISMENVAVNGIMLGYFSQEVAPGMKGYGELDWYNEDLQAVGINYVQSVEGELRVYDYENYNELSKTLVNWEVETEETAETEEPAEPAVVPVVFENGIEPQEILTGDLVATFMDYDPLGYYQESPLMIVYVENNTDKTVYFDVGDLSVNGFMINSSAGDTVLPGAKAYIRLGLWKEDLESSHIDTVEDVELTVSVRDDDSWDSLTSGSVTIDLTGGAAEAPAA